jgi:N-acetyltransferase
MPDLQPTLIGDTIIIRPIHQDDWVEMYKAASDRLIWELHPAKDRYKEDLFRQFFDAAIKSKSAFSFIDKANGTLIGSSRYNGYNPLLSEVEIGWTFLACNYWGGVTNREIKKLMVHHAFIFVDTVTFWVGELNLRSQRAMEKIGGHKRPGLFSRLSTPNPSVVYELTKAQFSL